MKIKETDSLSLPGEITEFAPVECMDCDFDGDFPQQWFVTDSITDDAQITEFLSQKGFTHPWMSTSPIDDEQVVISVSRCPECGSQDIVFDF